MPDLIDEAGAHVPPLQRIASIEDEVLDGLRKECLSVLGRLDDPLLEQLLDQERRSVGQRCHHALGIAIGIVCLDECHAAIPLNRPRSSSVSAIAARWSSVRSPGKSRTSKPMLVDAKTKAS